MLSEEHISCNSVSLKLSDVGNQVLVDAGSDDGAGEGSSSGNQQAILPIVVGLILDGKQLEGQSGAQVSGQVHGESGGAAKTHTDGPGQKAYTDGKEAELLEAACNAEDSGQEYAGGKTLDKPVAGKVAAVG